MLQSTTAHRSELSRELNAKAGEITPATLGDFAHGQRTERGHTHPGDFATGMRSARTLRTAGDFAAGMRSSRRPTALGDFATGMRTAQAAVRIVEVPADAMDSLRDAA
jgi:hypothetical protein